MDFSSETVIHHYMRKIPETVFGIPFTSFVGARRAVPLRLSFLKFNNPDYHSRPPMFIIINISSF